MSAVGIREFKTHASEILKRVRERGESVDVTYRGEVVAQIVPAKRPRRTAEDIAKHLEELDRTAERIGKVWPAGVSAVDAVRGARRDL